MDNNQINEILSVIREMLEELSQEELDIVDTYITNHCSIENTDSEENYPNMFRDLICDPWYDMEEYRSWNPDEED